MITSQSSSEQEIRYREQAAQLRGMANTAPNRALAEQLLQLADEYDRLAGRPNPAAIVSGGARPASEKELYRSSNGDCWYLVREPASERMLVRHQPNRASGGSSSLIRVENFLAEDHTPQQEALLRVIEGEPRTTERQ
jgi:hypothetical protein